MEPTKLYNHSIYGNGHSWLISHIWQTSLELIITMILNFVKELVH